MTRKILPTLLTAAVLAACSEQPAAETAAKPTPTNTASSLDWQNCSDPAFEHWFKEHRPNSTLQCAYLSVPLAADQPQGRHIRIAVTRLPAEDGDSGDNLLILGGGPGQDSLNTDWLISPDTETNRELRRRFNLIGIAQRGIAPAEPEADCGRLEDAEEKDAAKRVASCVSHMGEEMLAHIGTRNAADDIETLRLALGGQSLSIIGYSYGTQLLATYARHYGQNLRAGVLDGVVDTTESLFSMVGTQEKGFQRTFERFAAYCAAEKDCPIQNTATAQAEFHAFLNRIHANPPKDRHQRPIDGDKAVAAVVEGLYSEDYWPLLARMMNELEAGKSRSYDKLIYDFGFAPPLPDGEMPAAHWAFIAVTCADYAPAHDRRNRAEYLEKSRTIDNFSPYDNFRPKTEPDLLDECFYWPHAGTADFSPPVLPEGSPTLLLVSHTEDPATPYRNAQTMAGYLKAPLISLEADGHTAALFGTSRCVDETVAAYLLNPANPPASKQCRPD